MERLLKFASKLAILTMLVPAARAQTGSGIVCVPATREPPDSIGCFILATPTVGRINPSDAYWHLSRFADQKAAQSAAGEQSAVVDAFGQIWLLTIAPQSWRPTAGTHVQAIGPLPVKSGVSYVAQYMKAVLRPGMKSIVHRHSGPEAWYTVAGETCLETSDTVMVGRAGGEPVIVPGGPPMELTATGTEVRKALVLILHDASQAPSTPATDWKPRHRCKV
jgi:quercetin dioxygenase-like cupin family protein